MAKISGGLLPYRLTPYLQVFLVHPGGPFFARKDDGFWTIAKGLVDPNEDILSAAIREFKEETGLSSHEPYISLGSIKRPDGKIIHAFAFASTWTDPITITSNTTVINWPPKTGQQMEIPEVDRGQFFDLPDAKTKIQAAQVSLLDRLVDQLLSFK